MPSLSANTLLMAWETGRIRHSIDRALLLFALAAPDADPDTLADQPLGRRNAALLQLRRALFGDRLRGCLACTACGEQLELELDAAELVVAAPHPPQSAAPVEVAGLRFRPPTSRDLADIGGWTEADAAALSLLERCRLDEPSADAPTDSLASCIDQIEAALERADPWVDLTLAVRCDACAHVWQAPFDIAAFLWEEIDAYARGLLHEVHLLARAYGWREADILALSEARRAAYLERVTS